MTRRAKWRRRTTELANDSRFEAGALLVCALLSAYNIDAIIMWYAHSVDWVAQWFVFGVFMVTSQLIHAILLLLSCIPSEVADALVNVVVAVLRGVFWVGFKLEFALLNSLHALVA